jgi:hypothetical protein
MALSSKKTGPAEQDPREPTVTSKVPLVPFKVLATDIPFYQDQECTDEVSEAHIVILQALDPDDQIQELDIVPTTKSYKPGMYVSLAFDNKKLWENCWFKDPETNEIQRAWRIHVNFIGEVVSPTAVEKERDRLDDLERRVQEKIEQISRSEAETVN